MVLWQKLQDKIISSGFDVEASRPIVYVNTKQQFLRLVSSSDEAAKQYSVSTSRFGLGQLQNSQKTPIGIHRIKQKIGANEAEGRVFKARIPTDQICLPEDYDGFEDVISSRILWLDGLEPGFNCGGEVDTYQRYIYIHGTPDETHLGQPASIGCIRMNNLEVMEIFDRVEVNDLVIIE